MLWQTHIRIANEVLFKLGISKSSVEADRLREGSVTPDKWEDYPHHYGKSGKIEKYVLEARRLFLNDDLVEACFCLGVALHYIQDSYTSLLSRSRHHSRWEQQIEESYFTDDLENLVERAFHNRPDRREEYKRYARALSYRIEGKGDTLRIATMPGPGLSFWGNQIWGKPYVDLNFALKTSLTIAKSVFGAKTNPTLEAELKHVLEEYQVILEKTEMLFAEKLVELVKKRDELQKRKVKGGFFQIVRNCFLTISSKTHDFRAKRKLKQYEQKKHMERVLERYQDTVKKIVEPHRNWYDFDVPQLDIRIAEKELLSIQEASERYGISESIIEGLIEKGKLLSYYLENRGKVRKSELEQVLQT